MAEALHLLRFPGETDGYREARNALLVAERELRQRMEAVAAQRRALPLGGRVREDYVFEGAGGPLRLSELFAPGKDSLVVYSFMYGPAMAAPCPMCTSFLDGFDRAVPHLVQRLNVAVVARSPIARLLAWQVARGWAHLRLLSSSGNTYNVDYGAETPEGGQLPACTVFVRRPDGIFHSWSAELLYVPTAGHPRHVDLLWPIWSVFDLTPEGRGDWLPRLAYE
jgi:predicted dithiol-disulfide oxidoreductase (DUF899 family)